MTKINARKNEISNGLIRFFNDTKQKLQDTKILDLNEITAGWETELFSFEMQYSENDEIKSKKLVIRMYPGDSAEGKLTNEFFIYTNLSKQNYPVPKIHYMSTDKQYVGKPFLIMDWILGGTLDSRLSSNLEETIELFCRLFVELHSLDWKPFIGNRDSSRNSATSIDNFLDLLENRVKQNNLDELSPILTWLRSERNKIKNEYLALGHFDFHTFNILLNENGDPIVIDWPSARVSDFRFDLGWTLTLYRVYMDLESRNRLFDTYQKIVGKQIEQMDFFEVSAILRRLSDILIVFKSNAENAGLENRVAQMIKESISHVENLNTYLEELSGLRITEIDELIKNIRNNKQQK
ncbi:MAG: phosphotransferase [Candidatus Heimdallarchaeota archaeon]|nr:phosphotransferase [Candidatus Heimdallarchaeota archaeon]MBY8994767.1 phosphotransferase [Candidatus Heimdallarchaeota archaeon]